MSKPLDHPDYRVPGTDLLNLSKWSRENDPKPPHKFPIGQVVTVDFCHDEDDEDDEGLVLNIEHSGEREVVIGIRGKATLIVVAHHFDCDGTALYHLAAQPIAPPELFGERMKWSSWVRFDVHGIGEESLTPIEGAILPVKPWDEFRRELANAFG
jgi:hypothetical protein